MEDESNGRENLNVYVPPEGRLARSEVPIKKEFLKPVYDWRGGQKRPRNEETNDGEGAEKSVPNDGEGADASQDQDQEKCTASSSSSSSSSDKQPHKKKGRFTKSARKERKANTKKALYLGKGLCHTFCNTGFCSYGDSCRMSHDLAGFMAWKPADLLEYCPVYERTGTCPMGIRCRYASKHTNPDGSQIPHPDFASKSVTDPLLTPLNVLDRDTLFSLKKREMDFTKTKEAVLLHTGKASTFLSSKKAKQNKPAAPVAPVAAEKTAEAIEGEIHLLGASGTDAAEQKQIIREEKKTVDFKDKLILAPLTTIGNLPYRRICKRFGADITVGEMALSINLLQGSNQEWALAKRHPCEDVFGVQLAGSHGDNMGACAELISERLNVDFIDVNCGCPIDLICDKGAGSSLLERTRRLEEICKTMSSVMTMPLTVKIRTGYYDNNRTADKLVPKLKSWGVSAVTIHGRTREQRYTKLADWEYIDNCSKLTDLPVIGNGDIYNYTDVEAHKRETGVSSVMLARGAIIKPWLFEEIKQQKHWDISGSERLDILKDFSSYGLEYWGSDDQGVENTRSFLLNWLSFTCRYVPVGILEVLPTQMNHRPPPFVGRDDRETLLSSNYVEDWIKISEMLLGPVPDGFHFEPKHKANSFSSG